jgi:hypothetical protein
VSPAICICCCEPMSQRGNSLSRNPNVCASCSSLLDGMDDADPGKVLASAVEAEAKETLAQPAQSQDLAAAETSGVRVVLRGGS